MFLVVIIIHDNSNLSLFNFFTSIIAVWIMSSFSIHTVTLKQDNNKKQVGGKVFYERSRRLKLPGSSDEQSKNNLH